MNRILTPYTRRTFVQGAAAIAALGALDSPSSRAFAAGPRPSELSGTQLDLEIAELPVNYTGRPSVATAVNGQVPAPILRVKEGDTVTLRVKNRLSEMTTIHWHGLIVPPEMDGVPGISFPGIAPGETFTYRFTIRQSGTYWYHAHTLHEQTGLYGALIVEPRTAPTARADRDYAVLLSDWTDESPLQVYLNLKKMGSYYNFGLPTTGELLGDISRMGLGGAARKRQMWNRSRMNATDYSDVTAVTYTYLMNGTSPASNWTGIARAGERVRLRFIGAGTATFFDVRIPGLKLTVVSTDGQDVEPVEVDEFRVGPGETYDVIVQMPDDRAYTIFAQSLDRTGFARGTLAPRAGMEAEVPSPDTPVWLSDVDMMGAMAMSMGNGGEHAGMSAMPAANSAASAHGQHSVNPDLQRANHARSEYGPGVDMRVDYPRDNIDDPGVNLRNSGRRVLTYADLRTVGGPLDAREPNREIELHLTGNMERFQWSLDGLKLNEAKPIRFVAGERLRMVLVNDSTMTHPMHLHGMWTELESGRGEFQARKHTVSVQPAQRVHLAITADAPGRWAFHCHLLYHMAAGMFREVVVA